MAPRKRSALVQHEEEQDERESERIAKRPRRSVAQRETRDIAAGKDTNSSTKSESRRGVNSRRDGAPPGEKTASKSKQGRELQEVTSEPKSSKRSAPAPKEALHADGDGDSDGRQYWLMKAEPEPRLEKGVDVSFSIDDLKAASEPEGWDGVRSFRARNNMREMKTGDLAFFYHSNCKLPGIAGTMEIVQEASDDVSALDPKHPYHDPKSTAENPKWSLVHVGFRRKFDQPMTLADLRSFGQPGGLLENMEALKQSRLSVSRVRKIEWDFIMAQAKHDG